MNRYKREEKMKTLCISWILLSFIALLWASDPITWQWAEAFNVTGTGAIQGGRCDAQGNIYVCGFFGGELTLGAGTYTATGSGSGFVTKLNSEGEVQWAGTCSNTLVARIMDCVPDGAGNLYVTGYQYGPTTFGSITSACPEQIYRGFVAKINSSGVWQWARTEFSPDGSESHFITRDAAGNLYLLGNNNLNGSIFVAKLNSSGEQTWRTVATGENGMANIPRGLILDHAGNIIILCVLHGSITIGNDTLVNEHGASSNDFILAKLNSSGAWQWARDCEYTNNVEANGVAVDAGNNVLIAGVNLGYPAAGTVTMGTFTLTASLVYDMMVFKVAPNGDVIGGWDNATGTSVGTQLKKMVSDGNNNFYCFGITGATGCSLGSIGLANIGIFVARMDANANWQEVKLQALNTVESNFLAGDGDGHLIIGNGFASSVPFGGITLNLISPYGDFYVAKTGNIGPVAADDPLAPAITGIMVCPNPSRDKISIELKSLDKPARLMIYNLKGQLVKEFEYSPGQKVVWDGRNATNKPVASGVYCLRAVSGSKEMSCRICLLK